MSKRNLTDERQQARDLYVTSKLSLPVVAQRIGVHVNTIREWAKQDDWRRKRRSVLITGQSIVDTLKLALENLNEEALEIVLKGQLLSDLTLSRIAEYSKVIREIDGKYDEKGTTVKVMTSFTNFLRENNESETIGHVSRCLENFYKTINAKN